MRAQIQETLNINTMKIGNGQTMFAGEWISLKFMRQCRLGHGAIKSSIFDALAGQGRRVN